MKILYENGQVYRGSLPLAEAFVVEDGCFVFVGSRKEAEHAAGEDFLRVDLAGRFVCSGFNDSHMHLLNYGHMLGAAQLAGSTSLEEMLRQLQDFMTKHPPKEGGWLMGRGWNQDFFTHQKQMPSRQDLDRISTDIPICIVRCCGHCLVVNSQALKLAGITGDTSHPDGRFFDNDMNRILDVIPLPSAGEIREMIRTACKALNSYGITSCQTDDYSAFRQIPWQKIHEAYQELEAAGELTVRVCEQCNFTTLEELRSFIKAGNTTGTGSPLFRVGPLKLMGDGSLGSRTAFLSRPYADDPSTCGSPVLSQKTVTEMIGYAHKSGMQTAVHAIGDACLDMVLTALDKALAECPRQDHRHGIVHCQITRPDQLAAICRQKLHVYAQSIFLDYDSRIVERRVGKELADTSYSWKTLMETGVSVSNGSDCPVEAPDVLAGIQCAVTRTTLPRDAHTPQPAMSSDPGSPKAPHAALHKEDPVAYLPDQAFTVQEAIDSYTIQGAYASFEEQLKGQIRPGMLADFVILGQNPFTVPESSLRNIPVYATYLGGRKVFSIDP